MPQEGGAGSRAAVTPAALREQAALARRLLHAVSAEADRQRLHAIAAELEAEAAELERRDR